MSDLKQLVLFAYPNLIQGDLPSRTVLDTNCSLAADAKGIPQLNSFAFVSLGPTDQIADFPTTYVFPTDVRVTGPPPQYISLGTWESILGGDTSGLTVSLHEAKVFFPNVMRYFWTGTTSMGLYDSQTCSNWASAATTDIGTTGDAGVAGATWLKAGASTCGFDYGLLCATVQIVPTSSPTHSPTIKPTTVSPTTTSPTTRAPTSAHPTTKRPSTSPERLVLLSTTTSFTGAFTYDQALAACVASAQYYALPYKNIMPYVSWNDTYTILALKDTFSLGPSSNVVDITGTVNLGTFTSLTQGGFLTQSLSSSDPAIATSNYWTGATSTGDYNGDDRSCNRWTDSTVNSQGRTGDPTSTGSTYLSSGTYTCDSSLPILCLAQQL